MIDAGIWDVDGAKVCFAQTIGGRKSQQDAYASFKVNIVGDTTSYLKEAFRNIYKKLNIAGKNLGSTCTVVHISADNILTIAFVGDSPAFLVDSKRKAIKELVTVHHVTNQSELNRLLSIGTRIHEHLVVNRLNYGFPLTRAFTSLDFNEVGVTCDPEIIKLDLMQLETADLSICLASDGILDGDDKILDGDNKVIRSAVTQDNLAYALVASELMFHKGPAIAGCDNVSLLSHKFGPDSGGLVMVLCDGHGRDKRADSIAADICVMMQQELKSKSIQVMREWRTNLQPKDFSDYEMLVRAEAEMDATKNRGLSWLEQIRAQKSFIARQ